MHLTIVVTCFFYMGRASLFAFFSIFHVHTMTRGTSLMIRKLAEFGVC